MNSKIVSILMAMMIVAIFSLPSSAQAPDFSICSGQQGAAFGLCRGGVAVGCDVDDNSSACASIAEQFKQITGALPPYGGAGISPNSGNPGITDFTVTDTFGRIQAGDMVVFYLPRTDPTTDGFLASVFTISADGTELTGRVPPGGIGMVQGLTYLVRVTPNFSLPRFADLEFFVELGPACPPDCQR